MQDIRIIFDKKNIQAALKHISGRKRIPGADGVDVASVTEIWNREGEKILSSIFDGTYRTIPFLEIHVSKKGKQAYRSLQLPSAMDRVIAKIICTEMVSCYDPLFSENSFGFRKKRGAHDGVRKCLSYMNKGYEYVVDLDIEKFFDNVNHKYMRYLLQVAGEDEGILTLLEQFYAPKVICGRHEYRKYRGLPQGCSLSPVLANIYLNQMDRFLERNGYCFVRYADDLLVFFEKQQQAEQALYRIEKYLNEELSLKLNKIKTGLRKCDEIVFLGYSFGKKEDKYVCLLPNQIKWNALCRMRAIQNLETKDISNVWTEIGRYNRGWTNYYQMVDWRDMLRFAKIADSVQKYSLSSWLKGLSNTERKLACEGLYDCKEYSSLQGSYRKIYRRLS